MFFKKSDLSENFIKFLVDHKYNLKLVKIGNY